MTVEELKDKVPEGSLVRLRLDEATLKPDSPSELIGWWDGVVPNPKVNPMILDSEHPWHWLAQVVDFRSNQLVYDVHLAAIINIEINPEP